MGSRVMEQVQAFLERWGAALTAAPEAASGELGLQLRKAPSVWWGFAGLSALVLVAGCRKRG
eukprot:5852499-Pleurochrysis_carterae.AAC.6